MMCEACKNAADKQLPHNALNCDDPITCTCQHLPYGTKTDWTKVNGQGTSVRGHEASESTS